MSFIWAAIGLGFISSFHCMGMCGPIALALPIGKTNPVERLFYVLVYNSGRILTYAALGATFGLIGSGLFIGGFQQTVSITIGLFLLVSVIFTGQTLQNTLNNSLYGFFSAIKSALSALFGKQAKSSIFLIGLLNGLLPCGMVYLAIAAALTTGSFVNGSLFMAFFGVGTMAVMFTLPLFSGFMNRNLRSGIQKLSPVFKVAMAILLILRGLNLGIPYLSPEINSENTVVCHTDDKDLKKHALILCAKPKTASKTITAKP